MSVPALKLASPISDPRYWVPSGEAADTLGCNPDHLTRLCRTKLHGQDLAWFGKLTEGGQERWHVHRSYDPRLGEGALALADQEPALEGFTEKQKDEARQRAACVRAFGEARSTWPGLMKQWMPRFIEQLRERFPSLRISDKTLYAWAAAYKRPADLAKLIDRRGGNQRGQDDPAAWAMFADLYLHQNQPALKDCWEIVRAAAAEHGWKWCSLTSCYAQLDRRIPPEVQAKHRRPQVWRQQLRPFIEKDPDAWKAGERWIGDHKQFDVVCRFGDTLIRPWLTPFMDLRTRKVMGFVVSANPDSRTILAALRHGLMNPANTAPSEVSIDNGKDYDCWTFHGQTKRQRLTKIKPAVDEASARGIFGMLQIGVHFSLPHNPNGKAELERHFGRYTSLCRMFETYCGFDTDNKPERLAEVLKTQRLIPTFEHVQQRAAAFIDGYNDSADHDIAALVEDGERLSPNEAMRRWCTTKRVMADPAALDLLLAEWSRPLTVGRNGVAVPINGRTIRYGFGEPALSPFKGLRKADRKPVYVRFDPHDLSRVQVFDQGMRFVCSASMNQLGGGSDPIRREHVAELNRQKNAYARSLKHVAAHSITSILTNEEHAAAIAAERPKAPEPERPAGTMRIVTTPLDGEARHVRRDQLKAAVGAEQDSFPVKHTLSPIERFRQNIKPAPRPAQPAAAIDPWAKLRERNHAW